MISPVSSAVHQGIGFLIRNDMVQHDVMQALLRSLSTELARIQAAESLRPAVSQPTDGTRSGAGRSEVALAAGNSAGAVVPPLQEVRQLLPTGQVGSAELWGDSDIGRRKSRDQQKQSDQTLSTDDDLDDIERTVVQGIAARLPELVAADFCTSVLVGLFSGQLLPNTNDELWRHEYVVVLVPQEGQLGRAHKIMAYGISRDQPTVGVTGTCSEQDNILQDSPVMSVIATPDERGFWPVSTTVERTDWPGRAVLLGQPAVSLATRYILDLELNTAVYC
ncbi:MAG: hypothetical protein KTR33_16225 [Gammaproteobacteria bacterium]|nr:hypothetical protein [Gammaproteobacteria bacterium]